MDSNPGPAQTQRRTLGVAMIGGGLMAKAHTMAWNNVQAAYGDIPADIRLVILADATEELAAAGAAQYGYEHSTASWEEALAHPDVDIVDIVTPNFLHQEVAVAAAKAGKHIWCEKPLATTADGALAMTEAAEAAGVKTMVGFTYLHNPGIALAKRLVEAGEIGDPVSFSGTFAIDTMTDPDVPFTWRQDRSLAGTGALGDVGAHIIAIARHLVGGITQVSGLARTTVTHRPIPQGNLGYGARAQEDAPMHEVENDDLSLFLATFDNGAIGSFEASRISSGRSFEVCFTLTGTRGAIRFDQQHMYELQVRVESDLGGRFPGLRRVDVGPGDGVQGALWPLAGVNIGVHELKLAEARRLIEAIIHDTPTWPDFREGWEVERTIEAIDRAAQSGVSVQV